MSEKEIKARFMPSLKYCFIDQARICGPSCALYSENLDDKGRVLSAECAFMSIRWISLELAEISATVDDILDILGGEEAE